MLFQELHRTNIKIKSEVCRKLLKSACGKKIECKKNPVLIRTGVFGLYNAFKIRQAGTFIIQLNLSSILPLRMLRSISSTLGENLRSDTGGSA